MKNETRYVGFIALGLVILAATAVTATEGVSPGALDRMAKVNNACPTFSWSEAEAVVRYELVAYVLPEDSAQPAELTSETEVLYAAVPAGATSWTPSTDKCLAPGGRYVWFVRAVNELAGDEVVAASEWSEGRYFTVPAAPSPEEMQRALDVLRRWDAANGGGSLPLFAAPAPAPVTAAVAGTGADADAGSAAPKSVPTASAAIRGEHPDTSGEKYGVVGTSASSYGAGVAAANLNSGPDLVLDGSADSGPDARLYEWGLERESATDGHFQFINPGAGALNLEVDGTVAATGLDCPDCVTSAEIADLSIAGADLADDAVTGAKIADGTVDSDDLAPGAVTGIKIAAGAVDTSQIRADAVETAQLADNAVNGAKILDGAVRNADLGNNAVTTDKIADGSVTSAKILNGSITWIDLAEEAVGSFNIEDGGVRSMDIEAGAVGSAQLADNSVTSTIIADSTITAEDVDPAGGVYASKSAVYVHQEAASIPGYGVCDNHRLLRRHK